MYDLGIVVGKCAPLTIGHINLITQASLQAKKVLVVLSHDQRWVDRLHPDLREKLGLKNRLRWLHQQYADSPHIDIEFIIEDDIPEFPNGWSEYCNRLREVYNTHLHKTYCGLNGKERVAPRVAIFSSEIDYDKGYEKYLPELSHVVVDANRTRVPISATQIRNDLYTNWHFMPSLVRRDFTKRVVILGQESTGKTTMVKNLAKMFDTSWVEEAGRTYCEVVLGGTELTLRSSDYPIIAYEQRRLEAEAVRSANRVCICDTNAFVTEYYHRLYEGVPNPIVTAMAADERYDLVIILEPTVPWVDDGLRINDDRSKTTPIFNETLAEFPNQTPKGRTFTITSSSYQERFDQAYEIINNFLKTNGGINAN